MLYNIYHIYYIYYVYIYTFIYICLYIYIITYHFSLPFCPPHLQTSISHSLFFFKFIVFFFIVTCVYTHTYTYAYIHTYIPIPKHASVFCLACAMFLVYIFSGLTTWYWINNCHVPLLLLVWDSIVTDFHSFPYLSLLLLTFVMCLLTSSQF